MAERICCLERTCPLWRMKYSSRANSLLESSIFSSPRQAWRERRSIVRPSVCINADLAWPERRVSAPAAPRTRKAWSGSRRPPRRGHHLVARVVAGREHQDRKVGAPETDAPWHLAAIQAGQRDIE